MSRTDPLARLTRVLSRLPGIGRRSGERIALRLVTGGPALVGELMEALEEVRDRVVLCRICGNITTRGAEVCDLCSDSRRANGSLCVVEDPAALALMEKSGGFRGRYHVLHGKLSPMRGQGAEQIRARALVERVRQEEVREVILALDTDTESDATASYVQDLLREEGVQVFRLGFGLPAGSGIAYSDAVTLMRAMEGKRPVA